MEIDWVNPTGQDEYQRRKVKSLAANPEILKQVLLGQLLIGVDPRKEVKIALPPPQVPTLLYGPDAVLRIRVGQDPPSQQETASVSVNGPAEELLDYVLPAAQIREVGYRCFGLPDTKSTAAPVAQAPTKRIESMSYGRAFKGSPAYFDRSSTARALVRRQIIEGNPHGSLQKADLRYVEPILKFHQTAAEAVLLGIRDIAILDGVTNRAHIKAGFAWDADVLQNSGYEQVTTAFVLNREKGSLLVGEQDFFTEARLGAVPPKASGYRLALDYVNAHPYADCFVVHLSDGQINEADFEDSLALVRLLVEWGRFGYGEMRSWESTFLTSVRGLGKDVTARAMVTMVSAARDYTSQNQNTIPTLSLDGTRTFFERVVGLS